MFAARTEVLCDMISKETARSEAGEGSVGLAALSACISRDKIQVANCFETRFLRQAWQWVATQVERAVEHSTTAR